MTKFTVDFKAGESRWHPGKGVDYMMVLADDLDIYAEAEPEEGESANYDILKESILEQAREQGIDADNLKFWYD